MYIFPETDNIFSVIAYYCILIIAFVHIIGYIDLMRWFDVTGIGSEARRIQTKYGQIGIILLNASAFFLFIIIALIYINRDQSQVMLITSVIIVVVFLSRGIFGYVMVIMKQTGSTTAFWSLSYSTIAVFMGTVGTIGLKGGFK